MSRCRFESPEIVRLPLSDGDWIEVKRRLSAGEKRHMSAKAFTTMQQGKNDVDTAIGVDFAALGLSRTKAYLVDWSFRDKNDKPVRVSSDAIEALTEETLAEIEQALDKHIEAVAAEEKARSGAPASSPD